MKTRLLIIILLTVSVIIPVTSFAQKPVNCYFGNDSVSLDDIFEKDMAVKAFTEKHPSAIRHAAIEQVEPLQGEVSFTTDDNNKEEIILIKFNQNENGCYRPYEYSYSYDDGIIDATVRDSILNITEIINLIKLDDKKIFKMDFLSGYNKAEIIGFSYGRSNEFCGSVWGDDSRYISPHLQVKIGVEPWMVKCNDGLTLLLKPTEFTKPACVTDEASDKLSHRGWSNCCT